MKSTDVGTSGPEILSLTENPSYEPLLGVIKTLLKIGTIWMYPYYAKIPVIRIPLFRRLLYILIIFPYHTSV